MADTMRIPTGADFGKEVTSGQRKAAIKLYGNPLATLLLPRQYAGFQHRVFDFDDVTMVTTPFTLTKDAGGTSFAQTAGTGGMTRFVTGATSPDGGSILSPIIFKGDLHAGAEIRVKFSAVTTLSYEFGFIDDVTDKTTPAVTDVDTPTFGGGLAEGVVITSDTGETLATAALATKSATYTTVYKKTFFTPATNGTTGFTPTVDTYFTMRVQLEGDIVHAFIFDASHVLVSQRTITPAEGGALTGGIEGGTAMSVWFAVATLSAASKNVDVDYLAWWSNRY